MCLLFQANLRTRVTHSMQTNLSNMRRDTAIQVWPPKYVDKNILLTFKPWYPFVILLTFPSLKHVFFG